MTATRSSKKDVSAAAKKVARLMRWKTVWGVRVGIGYKFTYGESALFEFGTAWCDAIIKLCS